MTIEQQAVRREVLLPVDRDTAWASLCDAAALASWLADEVDVEIRPGAEGIVRWASGEERHVAIDEVVERRRIVLCWRLPDGDPSIVELTLDDVAGGTRLAVIELPVLTLQAVGSALDQGSGGIPAGPQMASVACAV
jgi:uncharacterized protein YndB with AHSA1/START domain